MACSTSAIAASTVGDRPCCNDLGDNARARRTDELDLPQGAGRHEIRDRYRQADDRFRGALVSELASLVWLQCRHVVEQRRGRHVLIVMHDGLRPLRVRVGASCGGRGLSPFSTGSKVRDPGSAIRDPGCGVGDPVCASRSGDGWARSRSPESSRREHVYGRQNCVTQPRSSSRSTGFDR